METKTVLAFLLKDGDNFFYYGEEYVATSEPSGEFSTYVKVRRVRDGMDSEIYIPAGNTVTIHE